MQPTLFTIPISHYCERARWALDWADVGYAEEQHLQIFSWLTAFRNGGHKTLPVLVTPDETLTDSSTIVRWASERSSRSLYPASPNAKREVEALEIGFADELGVESRRIGYDWIFRSISLCLPYNAGRAPEWETKSLETAFGLVSRFAAHYLAVNPVSVARAVDVVNRYFDRVANQLKHGERYLIGDAFTAADLTFATMAAPSILPEEYGVPLPPAELIPEYARKRVLQWRAHPAGQFALRMFRERPALRGEFQRPPRVVPATWPHRDALAH